MTDNMRALVAIDSTPVLVSGSPLHPILWRGRQWAVTEFGIESLDGTYQVARGRLLEDVYRHGWPEHMAEKEWVDFDDFATARMVALALHFTAQIDWSTVRLAIVRGSRIAASR